MSLQENKAIVRRFVDVIQNQHKLEALDEFFSSNFVDHGGMTNPPTLEGAKVLFAALLNAFPDHRFVIREQLAEGDKVMTHKTFHGTHLGPFMGIPPTEKPVTFDLIDIFSVENGQITAHWVVADMLSVMQQIGAVPAH